jgi:GMP synthase-like glutamine amidotransferase
MKPVAIFRFSASEGPGYFAEWLAARGVAHELVAIDQGSGVPADPRVYSGIGMMGGPMSANDALPWIEPLCELLRRAVDARVPVVGHCLGGQLLSRALGGTVARAPAPEIGWLDVEVEDESARTWFGGRSRFTSFQWHYESFSVPPGAQRLLRNEVVPNQAYVVDDLHVGFQCHIEMTDELVRTWCDLGKRELPPRSAGAVQSAQDIERGVAANLHALHEVADAFYARWADGLAGANVRQLASTTQV